MDNTQITDVILAILANNHELGFPKLLVVRDLVVVTFTFTNLEYTLLAFERDLKILELFSVNTFKLHVELVSSSLVGVSLEYRSLQVRGCVKLVGVKLTQFHNLKIR